MKLLIRFVRYISAWAWRYESGVVEGIVTLEELHATPGGLDVAIRQRPEMAQYVAKCFASMVALSPNYTEMRFELDTYDEIGQWITVTVQKGQGQTPHQLRLTAESELNALKAKESARLTVEEKTKQTI